MDKVELKRLLDVEPERLKSIELTAESSCTDQLCQKAAYRILTPEQEIPKIPDGVRRWAWHVWGQRPCSFREIEYGGPSPDLDEVVTFDSGASADSVGQP